jgi:hypothetical protein
MVAHGAIHGPAGAEPRVATPLDCLTKPTRPKTAEPKTTEPKETSMHTLLRIGITLGAAALAVLAWQAAASAATAIEYGLIAAL